MIKAKSDKINIINFINRYLLGAMAVFCAVLSAVFFGLFFYSKNEQNLLKAFQALGLTALCFLPKITKSKNSPINLFYYAFLLFAGVLGSLFDFYKSIAFYDILMHILSGILCAAAAYEILKRQKIKLNNSIAAAFMLTFTLACAAAWEMYEFTAFTLIKNSALSVNFLAGELGLSGAAQAVGAQLEKSVFLSQNGVQNLIKGEFDTFSDVLSAVFSGALCTVYIIKKEKQRGKISG